jgi:hypothetical protein
LIDSDVVGLGRLRKVCVDVGGGYGCSSHNRSGWIGNLAGQAGAGGLSVDKLSSADEADEKKKQYRTHMPVTEILHDYLLKIVFTL